MLLYVIITFYFFIITLLVTVPNIGVFPKWLFSLVGSAHMLIMLPSNIYILTGILWTGPFFIVMVAVPLNTDVLLPGLDISVSVRL